MKKNVLIEMEATDYRTLKKKKGKMTWLQLLKQSLPQETKNQNVENIQSYD